MLYLKCIFVLLAFFVLTAFAQTRVKLADVTGDIFRHADFRSKFTDSRNIDVWLPPGYENEVSRKYPVLYLHDGQNLFRDKESQGGVEWGVDETMTRLLGQNKIRKTIVVAVWSSPKRMLEFMPQKAFDRRAAASTFKLQKNRPVYTNSGSDDYLRFIVRELKPFIDKTYRTRGDRANTFIMGSSMGGLMSLYALGEYPQIFGGAACLSTQFALGKGVMLGYLERRLPAPKFHRIYFDQGTLSLDKENARYQTRADRIMHRKGYRAGVNWLTRHFPGEEHSELSWRKRVEIPLIFLLGK